MQRAVFLDRDGVINRALVREGKPYPPRSLEEFQYVDGAAASLARLKQLGLMLIVVTNQPDIARGTQDRALLDAMHERLRRELPVDEVVVCPHDDADNCDCRKPRPGMLVHSAQRHGIDLQHSYMVGDRWRDVEAGRAAGCTNLFINYGYRERLPAPDSAVFVSSLSEAADWIARQAQAGESHAG